MGPNQVRIRFYYPPNAQPQGKMPSPLGLYIEIDVLIDSEDIERRIPPYDRVVLIKELSFDVELLAEVRGGRFDAQLSYDGTTLYVQADTYEQACEILWAVVWTVNNPPRRRPDSVPFPGGVGSGAAHVDRLPD